MERGFRDIHRFANIIFASASIGDIETMPKVVLPGISIPVASGW